MPIHNNIKELDGKQFDGRIDLVSGGFPCQPFSVAGQKKGTDDDRDLWPEMFRVIQESRPTWVIGENVANFTNMEFTRTKTNLEGIGYNVQPFIIPACAVGAPHRRDRIWIIAYAAGVGRETGIGYREKRQVLHLENGAGTEGQPAGADLGCGTGLLGGVERFPDPDTNSAGLEGRVRQRKSGPQSIDNVFTPFWRPDHKHLLPTSVICRGDDGFSGRVDRLRSLGNAVTPQIPEIIGRAIMDSSIDGKR